MFTCAAKPNCRYDRKVRIVGFDADPDIDGIGLIAAIYASSFLTMVVLTATYITSDPSTYTTFGFTKLDRVLVRTLQSLSGEMEIKLLFKVSKRTKENFHRSLKKATLLLGDQQLFTAIALAVKGLVKHCGITKFHFNTLINLILATTATHSMTIAFTEKHISQNIFSRIGRALAILLLWSLCSKIWETIGNNDSLFVYGISAKCRYDEYAYGPLATLSPEQLWSFIYQGCAYSVTVFFPTSDFLRKFRAIFRYDFWYSPVIASIASGSMIVDLALAESWESISGPLAASSGYACIKKPFRQLRSGMLFVGSIFVKLAHAVTYGHAQVYPSYGVALCWTCHMLAGTAKLITWQRKLAIERGMRENENRWGYLQPLNNPTFGDPDVTSVESSEHIQDQNNTPPDDRVTEGYASPKQGPLTKQETARLLDLQYASHRREMEGKLWESWDFILYLGLSYHLTSGPENLPAASVKAMSTIYTTDPAPLVYDGRVYLYTGHDEDGSTTYNMIDWHLYSSADMVNWQDHGSPASLTTFSWANANAWAGQVIPRNGKFYFYVPVRHNTGAMAIGVGVSDSITGPFEDALGKPLVENNEIDPTVFIDDDGQAYLYWGNPNLWYVKLNEDMISFSGDGPTQVSLTTEGFGSRSGNADRPTTFEEAPWIYKRNDLYYLIYAANCCSEDIRYSTGTSATGPWTYRDVIMPTQGASFTNHPGIIDFNNSSYFFYHNGALPGGGGYSRSVAVELFEYNSDGTIPTIQMTTEGAPQIGTLDPYVKQEAETIAWSSGVETEICSEGGMNVGSINNGAYIKVKGVNFGDGAQSFSARVSSGTSGGNIELRLGSVTGTLVGTCTVTGTGDWQTWTTVSCPVSGATGTEDLFLNFTGGSGFLFNINWWQFE
ncbi:hypothetical protein V492_05848 [Pseudogymnoascus sp. VKM F-4246]|nr:hypothetical protein V492_05848 [Pseudogymnoascus sp. VKM F-4246]